MNSPNPQQPSGKRETFPTSNVRADHDPRRWNVLVTGAGGGIGRAVAQAFVDAGATVACTDRDAHTLARTVDSLNGRGVGIEADLADIGSLDELLDRAEEAVGTLDALAQLAAVLRRRPAAAITEDDWNAQFDINAKAAFFLSRAFAERAMRAGRAAAVVHTASQSWSTGGLDGAIIYAATKGALVTMTRGMARTYGRAGIRFNAVAPGFVDTDMLHSGLDPSAMDHMLAQVPLGRLAAPEEIASAIVYLASPASSYVTGTTLVVAGGQLMH